MAAADVADDELTTFLDAALADLADGDGA
ncbi:hypothetical protein [Bosea sp. (in: a-proteobacteria)]